MRVNQIKAGAILSYLTQLVHILSALIYTPIMLRLLGQTEYGLYQLAASVISYLSILTLGFDVSYLRVYSKRKVENDERGIAALNGMFLIVFSALAIICLACGSMLAINAELVFGARLSLFEINRAKTLMVILLFSMAIAFLNSVFSNFITAHEKFFFQRFIVFLKTLFNPFLTLPLLIMGYGSVAMVTISFSLTIFEFFSNIYYCLKKLKMKFSFRAFEFKLLKELWTFTAFVFIANIVNQLNWHIDKFILGRMIGTVAVAVYSVGAQLNGLYTTLSSVISGVFVTRVNSMVAEKKSGKAITDLFTKIGRVQFILLALVFSGYILYGREFVIMWAGEEYSSAYVIGIMLMLPVTVTNIQTIGVEIQRAKNKHKILAIVNLCIAIINVFLSIVLVNYYGIIGAVIGTFVSVTVGNVFINIYYHKRLDINIILFWKEIIRFLPAVCVAVIFGVLLKKIIVMSGIVGFITKVFLYAIIYCISMWLLGMNENEKVQIKGPLKKFINKIRNKKDV